MWHGRQSSQLEIAEDSSADGSCDPAEIIHGCEREIRTSDNSRARARLADVDTKDTWSESHLDAATSSPPGLPLGCFGIVLQRFLL